MERTERRQGCQAVSADPAVFVRERLQLPVDPAQAALLRHSGNRLLLNCTRQWGKSTVTAAKAVHRAMCAPGSLTLVVSPSARQSGEFLKKVRGFLHTAGVRFSSDSGHPISARLAANGARIIGLPSNEATTRGFSAVSLLIVDEASRVPDSVYHALTPSTATTDGAIWLLSTPFGARGFFWEAWQHGGEEWHRAAVPATECARIPAEFLEKERALMTESMFAQEYLCSFADSGGAALDAASIEAAFDDELEVLRLGGGPAAGGVRDGSVNYIVGVDLGRRQDHSAIAIVERVIRQPRAFDYVRYAQTSEEAEVTYRLRYCRQLRLGLSYESIAREVEEVAEHPLLKGRREVVMDATGVGAPVVESVSRRCKAVTAVTITSGRRAHRDTEGFLVPKNDLTAALGTMLDRGELQIAGGLRGQIYQEMVDFGTGSATHDDQVMAAALAVWRARRRGIGPQGNRLL